MKIIFEKSEAEQYFYDALSNGLYLMNDYGCELDYKEENFLSAKNKLKLSRGNSSFYYADVLMQILKDGNELNIIDKEGDDEIHTINLNDVHERMSNVPDHILVNMINETHDAFDADAIIQTIFFNDIIFG